MMVLEMPDFCQFEYEYISVPYTPELSDLKTAADCFNAHFGQYVRLAVLGYPACVRENMRTIYVKTSHIVQLYEDEETLMSREEYAALLRPIIAEKCMNCARFVSEEHCIKADCGFLHADRPSKFCVKYTPKRGVCESESISD